MSVDVSGELASSTTRSPEVDTTSYPIVWHRTRIHPTAQHGCDRCPPVPCPGCNHTGSLCPDYAVHRLGEVGSETYARTVA